MAVHFVYDWQFANWMFKKNIIFHGTRFHIGPLSFLFSSHPSAALAFIFRPHLFPVIQLQSATMTDSKSSFYVYSNTIFSYFLQLGEKWSGYLGHPFGQSRSSIWLVTSTSFTAHLAQRDQNQNLICALEVFSNLGESFIHISSLKNCSHDSFGSNKSTIANFYHFSYLTLPLLMH